MFNWGEFKSSAGLNLRFKIECDDMTDDDYDCIARMIANRLLYKHAIGVPSGGLRFAKAMNKYAKNDATLKIICDDVLTTGKSMEKHRGDCHLGIVLFSRGDCPEWIQPVFTFNQLWRNYEK